MCVGGEWLDPAVAADRVFLHQHIPSLSLSEKRSNRCRLSLPVCVLEQV